MVPEQPASAGARAPMRPGDRDIEDLRQARLCVADQRELFDSQTEAVLSFLQGGLPTSVVMSFVADDDGTLWFATVEGRRQVRGIDGDERVAVVVSNTGTELAGRRMVALRGTATVHRDREVVLAAVGRLAPRLAPDDPQAFVRLLDSPGRVAIAVTPTAITASHDSRRLAGNGRGGVVPRG